MQNDFLPADYEAPVSGSNFTKLQEGDTKLRILSKPIIGWLAWDDNKKPHRFTMKNKPDKPLSNDPKNGIKHFWAFIVWNYSTEAIQVFEVTQQTLHHQIQTLSRNEDWGAPFDYDLTINKKGKDKETKYHVTPSPKKAIAEPIYKAALEKPINLDALFSGGDPFATSNKSTPIEATDLPF